MAHRSIHGAGISLLRSRTMLPTLIILAIFSALTSGFQLPPGAHDNAHWRRPSALRCRLQEPGLAQGTLRASSGGITHISFDLDDTLWPTAEVVASANADLAAWLLPRSAAAVDGKALQLLMKDVRRIHQEELMDAGLPVTPISYSEMRRAAIELSLRQAGTDDAQARAWSEEAFDVWLAARNAHAERLLFPGAVDALARATEAFPGAPPPPLPQPRVRVAPRAPTEPPRRRCQDRRHHQRARRRLRDPVARALLCLLRVGRRAWRLPAPQAGAPPLPPRTRKHRAACAPPPSPPLFRTRTRCACVRACASRLLSHLPRGSRRRSSRKPCGALRAAPGSPRRAGSKIYFGCTAATTSPTTWRRRSRRAPLRSRGGPLGPASVGAPGEGASERGSPSPGRGARG